MPIPRAAIYCRVSTDLQLSGTSLTSQRDQCVDFAARNGWTVVAEPIDEGVSGAVATRPALDELLALCDRREVDVVVVSRLDRLGRSLRHLAAIIGRLDDAGISLVSVTDGFDSRTATGRLHRNILGSFAEFERELILERTTGGLRPRVREGWWPGGPPPYGYRLVRDGRHHRLEIDDTEARAIRTAVAVLVDEGGTTSDAARTLNALGYLPRQAPRWRYNHLRRFLLGAQLTGSWLYGRKANEFRRRPDSSEHQHVELRIPPILTPERQLALFERLEASRIPRQRQHPPRFYLLAADASPRPGASISRASPRAHAGGSITAPAGGCTWTTTVTAGPSTPK
jgi:site-specific DNA recombinase